MSRQSRRRGRPAARFAVLTGHLPGARPVYMSRARFLARRLPSRAGKPRACAPQQRLQSSFAVLARVLADDLLEGFTLRVRGLVQVPVVLGRPEVEIRLGA